MPLPAKHLQKRKMSKECLKKCQHENVYMFVMFIFFLFCMISKCQKHPLIRGVNIKECFLVSQMSFSFQEKVSLVCLFMICLCVKFSEATQTLCCSKCSLLSSGCHRDLFKHHYQWSTKTKTTWSFHKCSNLKSILVVRMYQY